MNTILGLYSQVGGLMHQLIKGTISKEKHMNEL